MRSGGVRHMNFVGDAAFEPAAARGHTKGQMSRVRLRFICSHYAEPPRDISNSYLVRASYLARR